uniref:Uncharacterized protein n=1 Tax=Anguilla anguilla TaxID=7936 RepID=A0A0E9V096_ANGAN
MPLRSTKALYKPACCPLHPRLIFMCVQSDINSVAWHKAPRATSDSGSA